MQAYGIQRPEASLDSQAWSSRMREQNEQGGPPSSI
jgi:hypothetical protein